MKDDLPILFFDSQAAFEAWLRENHTASPGLWLKMAKKDTGIPSVNYSDALDCALCYGWIDSQKASLDEQYWLQRFTPRKRASKWSKVNIERIEKLTAEGRMQPAGIAQVELAQADGRWQAAYDSQSRSSVPPELQAALDANPQAKAFFEGLNSANRYAVLYRIQNAKKPETRAAWIERLVAMLARGEKLHE